MAHAHGARALDAGGGGGPRLPGPHAAARLHPRRRRQDERGRPPAQPGPPRRLPRVEPGLGRPVDPAGRRARRDGRLPGDGPIRFASAPRRRPARRRVAPRGGRAHRVEPLRPLPRVVPPGDRPQHLAGRQRRPGRLPRRPHPRRHAGVGAAARRAGRADPGALDRPRHPRRGPGRHLPRHRRGGRRRPLAGPLRPRPGGPRLHAPGSAPPALADRLQRLGAGARPARPGRGERGAARAGAGPLPAGLGAAPRRTHDALPPPPARGARSRRGADHRLGRLRPALRRLP